MTWTYDPTTDIGKMRLLTSDTQVARPIMADEDYQAFLDMYGHVMPAAAAALDSIAANEVLSEKVVNILGLTTDGASVSKELRQRAKQLRDDYRSGLAADDSAIITIEFADDFLQRRERYAKAVERDSV